MQKKLNVSQGMVSKWESEDYNFTIESLAQIAEKLELNLEISLTRKVTNTEKFKEENQNVNGMETSGKISTKEILLS